MNPARERPPYIPDGGPWTDYFLNITINTESDGTGYAAKDSQRRFQQFTDGMSNTILVGDWGAAR